SSQSPDSIPGRMLPSATAIRHGPRSQPSSPTRASTTDAVRRGPGEGSGRSSGGGCVGDSGLLRAASRLPGGVDLVDQVEELPRVTEIGRRLDLGGRLGRVPEGLMEVWEGAEVLGLEVVVPQDVEVMLDELGSLFLDRDGAHPEGRILVAGPFLDDLVAGLGLVPG